MDTPESYVVFTIDNQGYALNLNVVERAVCAAEVTPLPGAPDMVLGVVNIHGRLITVINTRKRFNLPVRELDPKDKFVILSDSKRIAAIVVDDVTGIMETAAEDVLLAKDVFPDIENVEGIIKLADSIIYWLNHDNILSYDKGRDQHS
ncbi:Chemotaxis protein CheW [Pelotomaculum schinkii]|uniref:Chemotaxis protein CheW n=1 Tax=Pelotomaculum schinkii TaxID=78350 RepID=A0A4Y7REN0_9FIRM|nr:chemotaxis protein CheW [Pelotomaculum schinkii]TEB07243.1 Chemotaxis protein CheW [Pelotomaculum schinkii]